MTNQPPFRIRDAVPTDLASIETLADAPHPHLESLALAEHAEGRGVAFQLLDATIERSVV
jgi:GNAT superfamily N-acetyltransferase